MKTRTFYLGLPFIFSALKFSICILFDTFQHLHFQYLTNCGSFILCQISLCLSISLSVHAYAIQCQYSRISIVH